MLAPYTLPANVENLAFMTSVDAQATYCTLPDHFEDLMSVMDAKVTRRGNAADSKTWAAGEPANEPPMSPTHSHSRGGPKRCCSFALRAASDPLVSTTRTNA